ncbi:MAG TPA: hypothetical protein VJH90_02965 [archaeon]|nr:hypothetical protein [archaeon]
MKKYLLTEKRDHEILKRCNTLQRKRLSESDRKLVALIKTQLYKDWRKPLIGKLNELLKKYR